MIGMPMVSVIVPAFNAEHTIGGCLAALLAQDYPGERLEIIAVDNRSTDRTAGVMCGYPVRVVAERRVQSSYAARNAGLAEARGAILCFTDADCLPDPGWVRALVAALADEDAGGAAGRIEAAPGTTLVERFQVDERVLDAANAFTRPTLPFAQTANAAYRRVVFERVGLFDPSLVSGGDLDLSWRMQRAGWGLAYAPGALVRHRHRTTFRGLVKLYAKNGHGAALLGDRYPSYAPYQSLRLPLCRVKEMGEDLVRCTLGLPGALARRDGYAARRPLFKLGIHLGDLLGWLRWRLGPRGGSDALGYLSARPDEVREAV
ncbi:MAG TPA: glycosyltransferase [Candidatus Binatia bacterium]|nr:glycosyltransferase [Candidatus Binatia bacterium]